jgi:hypothetical protein
LTKLQTIDNLFTKNRIERKAKPIARWGRKATGLMEIAGLPQEFTGNPVFLLKSNEAKKPLIARSCSPSLAGIIRSKS